MDTRTNRLVHEKSPYLLEHASNPVDWWPWCDEAFLEAKSRDCPVFFSIGYSSCHWCHVMSQESFEDPKVAEALNEAFVCIKVDKEERPDIDQLYMSASQVFTGTGGWPLNVFMTWDKRPFFATTYIPKKTSLGRLGITELTQRILRMWHQDRKGLLAPSERLLEAIQASPEALAEQPWDSGLLDRAFKSLENAFDQEFGGFGQAPKFPSPITLLFLLRYYARTGQKGSLEMVVKTLKAMRLGGIYDQIGFGFHRYSTDRFWRVPHFEKMLYDQALLSYAYLEAYTLSHDPLFMNTAKETFHYALTKLRSKEGAFFSSQDADSQGEEGRYYLFEASEIEEALGEGHNFIHTVFGIETEGNFFDPLTRLKTGKNILAFQTEPKDLAQRLGMSPKAFLERYEALRQKLLTYRNERVQPKIDDKVLLDQNALMVASLAKGARVLNDESLLEVAKSAMNFLWTRMINTEFNLFHAYKDRALSKGLLDDYAFLVWALIELYESSFEVEWLRRAKQTMEGLLRNFYDSSSATFFLNPEGSVDLPVRPRRFEDSAVPSGSAVAIMALLKLSRALSEPQYERLAQEALSGMVSLVDQTPFAFSSFLCAMDEALGPSSELVLATIDPSEKETLSILGRLWRGYLPRTFILLRPSGKGFFERDIATLTPFRKGLVPISEKPTAYLCQGATCEPPTHDFDSLIDRILPVAPQLESKNKPMIF